MALCGLTIWAKKEIVLVGNLIFQQTPTAEQQTNLENSLILLGIVFLLTALQGAFADSFEGSENALSKFRINVGIMLLGFFASFYLISWKIIIIVLSIPLVLTSILELILRLRRQDVKKKIH